MSPLVVVVGTACRIPGSIRFDNSNLCAVTKPA